MPSFSTETVTDHLSSLFKEKLGCRNDQIEVILEDLCDKIARRNYELEIIASQVIFLLKR